VYRSSDLPLRLIFRVAAIGVVVLSGLIRACVSGHY